MSSLKPFLTTHTRHPLTTAAMHLTPLQELLCTPGELHADEGAAADEGATHADRMPTASRPQADHKPTEGSCGELWGAVGSGMGAAADGGAAADLPFDADIDKLLASPTSSEINTFALLSTPDIQSAWDAGIEFPPTPRRDTEEHEPLDYRDISSVAAPCVWVTPPQTPTSMSSVPPTPPQEAVDPPHAFLYEPLPPPMTPPQRTLLRPSFTDDPFVEVNMELFPEIENSPTPEPTQATSTLFSKFGSGPYVVSRIIHRLGRPNIPKLQEELKSSLKTVYKKAKKNDEEVTKKSFGNTTTETYSHSVLRQVLKTNGKKVVKVADSTQFLEKNCSDYMVYCSLNIEHFHFKGLSFSNMIMDENDGASHTILIQDGFLYCKYLKKSDNRNRRLLAKTVISFDEDGKLTNNSYIKEIYGVYRVS